MSYFTWPIWSKQNGSFQAIHGHFSAPTSDIQSILQLLRKFNCDEEKYSGGTGAEERQRDGGRVRWFGNHFANDWADGGFTPQPFVWWQDVTHYSSSTRNALFFQYIRPPSYLKCIFPKIFLIFLQAANAVVFQICYIWISPKTTKHFIQLKSQPIK